MTVAGLTAVAACRLAQGELTGNDARFFVLEAETWAGAEASLIGAAGGLALGGKIPLVNLSSAGALIRACEQVRLDLCYHKANAKLFASIDGRAIEDLAVARSLPNLTVVAPADATAAYQATLAAGAHPGPVYIRLAGLAQNIAPQVYGPEHRLEIGRGIVLRDGSDLTLVAAGLTVVAEALAAAELLRRDGIDARVIDLHTIKPVDRALIQQAAEETGLILTVEEHPVRGGLGGAVAEVLGDVCPVPMRILGISDSGRDACREPGGTREDRLRFYGLDASGIAASARRALEQTA
jgi:transketolase